MVRPYVNCNHPNRLALEMIDKDSLAGMGGTLATLSGSLHEYIGVVAGSLTIVFMLYKLWQEVRKNK